MGKDGVCSPTTGRARNRSLKRFLNLLLVFTLLIQLLPMQAFAASWDGKGSSTDTGSGQVSGTFSAYDDSLSGYRFSIHSLEDGIGFLMLSTATKNYKSILHFYIEELGMDFWSARLFKRL